MVPAESVCCLPSWGLSSASLPWPMLQALYIYLSYLHTLRSGEETYIISVILQINWDTEQVWHTGGAEAEHTHLTLARRTHCALSCPRRPLSPNKEKKTSFRGKTVLALSVQFSPVTQLCLTLSDPMDCSRSGLPAYHQLPELTQTHVLTLVMLSNHFILCRPLLFPPLIFPSIRVFSNESVIRIRCPKYWRFSVSISPSNEYLGLLSDGKT